MIAQLGPYPAYKESRLPWVGRIPSHWETRRLRHACDVRVSNVDKHVKRGETPIRLCNYVDVYKNERIYEGIRFMAATAAEDERVRFGLRKGDVLITKDSEEWDDIGVPALVEFEAPDLVCGYHVAILRPRLGLHGAFLHRALECHLIATQFHVEANGVTRYGLSHGAIRGIVIPVPAPEEQATIVRFLDWANSRLARGIRAKRRVIALLTEQKQAIIHRAVTRGMDTASHRKASGVPWLGEIPDHWELLRSKYIYREVDRRSTNGDEPRLSMSQKLGLVPSSQIKVRRLVSESYVGAKLCEKGDLVLNRLKAHLGVFALAPSRGLVSADYTVLRPIRDIDQRFFEAIYKTPACRIELRQRAKGIVEGFWRLYTNDFYDIRVPVPPLEEQRRIMAHLDVDLATVNGSIARIEREISLLGEYRTRLISDVVTGKFDVREVAARLPKGADPREEAILEEQQEVDGPVEEAA